MKINFISSKVADTDAVEPIPTNIPSKSVKRVTHAQKPELRETGWKSADLAILLPPLTNLLVICIRLLFQ